MTTTVEIEAIVKGVIRDVQEKFDQVKSELHRSGDESTATMFEKCGYSIFFSNPIHTLREGPIYFMGLNPGGSPDEKYQPKTWRDFLDGKRDWNAYLDENWSQKGRTYKEHDAPLQRRIRDVLEGLQGLIGVPRRDTRSVFSTNLYFFRSPDQKSLARYGLERIDCWQFHETFLRRVKPKLIVCNGNSETLSPYTMLRRKLNNLVTDEPDETLRGTRGSRGFLSLKSFRVHRPYWGGPSDALVLGIPHMSRYSPDEKMKNVLRGKVHSLLSQSGR